MNDNSFLCPNLLLGPSPSHIDADTKSRMTEFESFLQFPDLTDLTDLSNSFSFSSEDQLQQQDISLPNYSQFSTQEQEIINKEAASNIGTNAAATEEDIDHLLTDLFNEDVGGLDDSPSKTLFELPTPEEIGWSSFPDLESTEFLSSTNNQESRKDFFTVESWQLCVHNEFDWQNYDFPALDQLEDQDVLDARDLIVHTEISTKTQSSLQVEESSAETEETPAQVDGGDGGGGESGGGGVGGVHDVLVGQDTSSLAQEIIPAVEIPSTEDNGVLPDKISVMVGDPEVSLANSQLKSDLVAEIISAEPRTEDKKEEDLNVKEEPKEALQEAATKGSPVKSDPEPEPSLELSDGPGVKTRRGTKRKPGTVVDLLVSSYIRKRSSRCKVGAGQSESDYNIAIYVSEMCLLSGSGLWPVRLLQR